MTHTSPADTSDAQTPPDPQTTPPPSDTSWGDMDAATMNKEMVVRLLAKPPDPLEEGSYATRVLCTTGRTSGEQRTTPIAVVRRGGSDYLVSPVRARDWVQNLLADPHGRILTTDGADDVTAEPVTGDDAAAVVATYLARMRVPWALAAFPVDKEAPPEEIAGHLDGMAVFRLA